MIDTLHWPSGHLRGYRSLQAVWTYKRNKTLFPCSGISGWKYNWYTIYV